MGDVTRGDCARGGGNDEGEAGPQRWGRPDD
uniref:Uncharacterized protein n=1 Tax=Anguilla anguilla TaxID=7936 RepID=A0A0E9TWX7_ANGAN